MRTTLEKVVFVFLVVVEAVPVLAARQRPVWTEKAKVARWLVHNSDYSIASSRCSVLRPGCAFVGQPFGNVMSVSDGLGLGHSTGIVYTYLPDLDASTQDILTDPRITLTFSEKALGTCNSTAENPPCARLTIAGNLTQVPEAQTEEALRFLFSRHPEMSSWSSAHAFKPYWMSKEDITTFFFIDFYGGAVDFEVSDYLAANPVHAAEVNSLDVLWM